MTDVKGLKERLDAILVEESPMHPFGCAAWEEESREAIDSALAYIADLEAKLAVAREALEDAARKISECIVATERCGPADINVGRVQAYRLALSGIEPARTALNTIGEDHG